MEHAVDDATQQMSSVQKKVAVAISVTSFVTLIARHVWPDKVLLDQGTLALLALAAVPWLTLFFKKFKIPGVGEAETQDRVQGATEKPLAPPPAVQPSVVAASLSPDTMKVLATLW